MDDLLTIKEAAALMKITDRTIRRWIADGRLDASNRSMLLNEGDGTLYFATA